MDEDDGIAEGMLVQFPRPPLDRGSAPRIIGTDEHLTRCADPVHVFAEPLGRCQCGEELWPSQNP